MVPTRRLGGQTSILPWKLVNGKIKEYSVDRLKPARSDTQLHNTVPRGNQPVLPQVARSGCCVVRPTYLEEYVTDYKGGDVAPTMQ